MNGLDLSGDVLYTAEDSAGVGVLVVDVSDPSSPTLLGTLHLDGYAANVSVSGETAFVAAVHDVYVVGVSDPANPSVVDVIEDSAGNSLRGGDLLVLSLGGSVNVYDVSDPTMPSLLGSVETPSRAWNMFRRGATVAVSGERAGLLMLGIGGCLAPGSAPLAGFPSGDALDGSVEGRILQLRYEPGDGGFRTNVGAVNLSETATTVDVELFAADGGFLGSFEIALGPFGYGQSNAVFEGLVGGAVRGAYAVVSSDSPGASYLAYGSVVDNGSGDPIYVPARISE